LDKITVISDSSSFQCGSNSERKERIFKKSSELNSDRSDKSLRYAKTERDPETPKRGVLEKSETFPGISSKRWQKSENSAERSDINSEPSDLNSERYENSDKADVNSDRAEKNLERYDNYIDLMGKKSI